MALTVVPLPQNESGESNQTVNAINLIQQAFMNLAFNAGGLVIHGSASLVAKTVNTIKYMLGGNVYSKAAADMPTLVGTVANAAFNVFCFYVDTAGTLTVAMGAAGATLHDVVFPVTPATKTLIGYIIVNPTGTGGFVGGTTALDDGTVVPNVAYVDVIGPFMPNLVNLG